MSYPVRQLCTICIRRASYQIILPRLTLTSYPSAYTNRVHPTPSRTYATSSGPSDLSDPSIAQAEELVEAGTRALDEGDVEGAMAKYRESLNVRETSGGWFNLGVCEYHGKDSEAAIASWEKSIAIKPSSDAYTNLASAYILAKPAQPALAIKHLTSALELAPDDPEIAFNLAAVLESTNHLETALNLYEKAKKGGIERAAQNIRSISAKILAKRAEGKS